MSDKPIRGRPTLYTEELGDRICEAVACTPKGLDHICAAHDDFPEPTTVYQWRFKYENFSKKYLQAKKFQSELYAESTLDIAEQKATYFDSDGNEKVDPGHVAWQKLNVNTRQWHASKLSPKVYGDQKQIDDLLQKQEESKAEIMALRAQLEAQAKKDY